MFRFMFDDKPRLEAVTERDIDIVLMEEFESGSGFLEWFVSMTVRWNLDGLQLVGAWHSVSNEHGESDIVVRANRSDGQRLALLIENKVDAPPQPEQAMRYERRGRAGVTAGDWQEFGTCIVAPKRYLDAATNAAGYQTRMCYEDITEWMRANLPPGRRTEFKCDLILAAIDQQRRGYSPKIDPVVTRFFTEYWEMAESIFPELQFVHSGARPADSTRAEFRPAELRKDTQIFHKILRGCVDLQVSGCGSRIEELSVLNAALLHGGLKFAQATKSAALRIDVPQMDVREDFTSQHDAALAALKAAYKLASLMHLVRTE